MKKHADIIIFGKVQGVLFRSSAKEKADELGVCGYVKNTADGNVFIGAQAEQEILNEFIEWCKRGPVNAKVEKIDVKFSDAADEFSKFEIIHGK